MTIETIYNEIKEITKDDNIDFIKFMKLKDKLEQEIRKAACYKTTNKTRVNAIKNIASKDECRRSLQGYGIFGEYKGVTDSYHAIMIKQDEMPLPLVACDSDLEKYGNAVYPNLNACMSFDYSKENELTLDINDLMGFIKTNTKDKKALYKLGECFYNARYIKNVIDVIGQKCKIYFQGEYKPLYFVNDENEIGLVLPVKTY